MIIDQTFPSAFELKALIELPADGLKRLFYPGAVESGGHDGLNIRVVPDDGEAWIGTFAFARFGPRTVTGVYTTPNPTKLCVVSEGRAYIVDAIDPEVYENIPIIPVIAVRNSLKHRLLIFANNTEILAMGINGVAWRTGRLSWDSLNLTTMTDDTLCGVFWDIQSESVQGFTVDLETGAYTGGASAPD